MGGEGRAIRVEVDHVVGAPPDRLYAALADLALRPRWQETTRTVSAEGDGPAGVGTRWRQTTDGIGEHEMEVVAAEPGRRWVEEGRAGGGDARIALELAAEPGGRTRVRATVEMRLRGARRLAAPAIAPMIRHQLPRDLDRLADLAVGEGPANL